MPFYNIIVKMQDNFRSKIIYSLSITGVIVVFVLAVILYLGLDIRKKADSLSVVQGEAISRISKVSDLNKLKNQEKEAQVDLLKLNNALPRRDSLFEVSKDLAAFAQKRSLAFGYKFGEEVESKGGNPRFIRVGMNISGSYENILGFLRDIESSKYFINTSSLDLVQQNVGYTGIINSQIFFSD
jgi:Tfp pilus assembly protein PilO